MLMLMSNLRDLEIRHLTALDAVATEGTFARAAEKLGYTQSAISQQIASLEKVVDARVFDRPGGPRPVTLTPFGEQLLVASRDMLCRVDCMAEDLKRFRTGTVGRLTVGSFQSVSATVLPLVLGRMRDTHPGVEIRVFDNDLDDQLDLAMGRGELDLSFIVGEMADRYESRHLFDDPFVLVARPDQFAPGPVSLADLSRELGDGDIRLTVWQNLLISDIPSESLGAVKSELAALGLEWERPHNQIKFQHAASVQVPLRNTGDQIAYPNDSERIGK